MTQIRLSASHLAELIAHTDWAAEDGISSSIFAVVCSFIPGLGGVGALVLNTCSSDADLREKLSVLAGLVLEHDETLRSISSTQERIALIEKMLPRLGAHDALKGAISNAAGLLSIEASDEAVTRFAKVRIEELQLHVVARSGAKIEIDGVEQSGKGATFDNVGATTTVTNSTFRGTSSSVSLQNAEIHEAKVEFNTNSGGAKVTTNRAGLVLTPGKGIFGAEIEGDNPYSMRIKPKE